MKNNEILASVIIPCYNSERWILKCIESVSTAVNDSFEVLIADDGSTDSTLDIVEQFTSQRNNFRLLRQPHIGISAARNRALDAARGEFVFFVDSDDTVERGYFDAMIARLQGDCADFCVAPYNIINENDEKVSSVNLKDDYRFVSSRRYLPRIFGYSFDDVRNWYSKGGSLFDHRETAGVWRMGFRRLIIVRWGIKFDESLLFYEDALFISNFLVYAGNGTCIDQLLYNYRRHGKGTLSTCLKSPYVYCQNKLAMLHSRNRLDNEMLGSLKELYAASNVLSLLDIVKQWFVSNLTWSAMIEIFRQYLNDDNVVKSVMEFPLSLKKPHLCFAVVLLRLYIVVFIKKRYRYGEIPQSRQK